MAPTSFLAAWHYLVFWAPPTVALRLVRPVQGELQGWHGRTPINAAFVSWTKTGMGARKKSARKRSAGKSFPGIEWQHLQTKNRWISRVGEFLTIETGRAQLNDIGVKMSSFETRKLRPSISCLPK